ncbi:DUF805 domain-containing protein [Maricaulis maris]|uniref:Uncharacterized membrane protein YhaH (DUF805 family) n=1 Tax=Maricaulis maris TaxID=74318 RepID=A0A495DMI5_9PROT|nr:DUF805 domain-containing protein [Maricaulis maris]RKR03148.1 uncharacterized membrane protein YhaH (DUF805 family) [Maricaulis maris]
MSLNSFILNPADATRILFGASGKLSPQEFAQGIVAIMAAYIVLQFISLMPGLGLLLSFVGGLVLAFAWVCVYAKRFHDAGKSGWLAAAAVVAVLVIVIVANVILMPVLGVNMAGGTTMPVVTVSSVLAGIISSLVGNAVVGYFVYKMPTV